MGADSAIAWTDHTFNPWWGCAKVSAACANCYAETWAKRTGHDIFGAQKARRLFGEKHWSEPLKWARDARKSGKRAKVFCASMADVFEDRPELTEPRQRLGGLIRETADALDWLLLTKRPENFGLLAPETLALCWLGVTAEDQASADERIPLLLKAPAKVRFVSVEPQIGAVNLRKLWLMGHRVECSGCTPEAGLCSGHILSPGPDWVIVGGESGARARPFHLAWARSIRDQCKEAGSAFFFKQAGRNCRTRFYDDATRPEWEESRDWPEPIDWDECDGQPALSSTVRLPFSDLDGRDPAEWPADIRVREFPD